MPKKKAKLPHQGDRIDDFGQGWAMIGPGVHNVAHYWNKDRSTDRPNVSIGKGGRWQFWRSLCGALSVSNDVSPPAHRGTFPKCQRCKR